ncbi:MAG: ABC transporter permease [Planctomycetes bacterium]|nr:ABC transporter permease [Planctomycetota bacterium]
MIPISYNLRSLSARKRTTAASALGIALVVFVLSSTLMLGNGVRETLGSSGSRDMAIVVRKGSEAELESTVEQPQIGLVLAAPGVKKGEDGRPLGVGEVIIVAALEKLGTEGMSNVQVRGVTEDSTRLRPEVRVIAGRPPTPGTDEVMIGRSIRGRFKGVDLDQTLDLKKNRPVRVVGVFASGGSSYESEVWVDLDFLRSAFGREGMVSSVRVRLESPAAFEGFEAGVEQDKSLGLEARQEREFYESQGQATGAFVTIMGSVISFFFALGAMIGAAITMFAAVAHRQREIGILRAIGFTRLQVLTAFLAESFALALAGGLAGVAASLGMGLVKFSMMNFASWSEISFSFTPTPGILLTALVFAAGMGLIGGFLPALRAARISPARAMRG